MAAVTNLTGLTVIDDIINAEWIAQEVHVAAQSPMLYKAIARPISLVGKGTRTYAHPIWARIAAATAVTESDEVAATALSSSEVTLVTALSASAAFVTDQAAGAAVLDVFSLAINRVVDAAMHKINDDVLALSTSITSSAGSNATTNDVSNMNTAITAFRAVIKGNLSGRCVAVMHEDALRDLGEDAVNTTNSLFGSAVGESLFAGSQQVQQGQFAQFGKVTFVSTEDMPVGDTTGWSNMLLDAGGPETLLGIAVSKEVSVELWREPKRFGTWVIASTDHKAGILDQSRGHEFITKT